MDKHKKTTVHSLSLPYQEPQWPEISADSEQTILRLLLPLLQPIGDFRRDHVARSKGKGRAGKVAKDTKQDTSPVWMPGVYDRLTIGFNSTVRRLEALARSVKPQALSESHAQDAEHSDDPGRSLSVLFVCRKMLPEIMTSSLPLLVATSARLAARPKLVDVSPAAAKKIAEALHQPRVGVLGIELDTEDAEDLLHFVHDKVFAMDVPWLDHATLPSYHAVKICSSSVTSKPRPATQSRKRKHAGDG